MGDKLNELSWSWISVRETVTMVLSFVTFFLLYFSVHVAEAFYLYTWTLLYVFSPLLIALYIFPATAPATGALFRSLIEVSCWKIVWSVLATLLWSAALSDINQPGQDISFVAAVSFNLILAGSLLLTPVVVSALAGAGVSGIAKTVGGIAVGATMIGPSKIAQMGVKTAKRTYQVGSSGASHIKDRYFAQPRPISRRKSPGKPNPQGHDQASPTGQAAPNSSAQPPEPQAPENS
jgi:hypothetical protein